MTANAFKSTTLVALMVLLGGCHQSPESKPSLGVGILARMEGATITTAEFMDYARQYQSRFAPQELQTLDRRALLNTLVNQKVLAVLAIRAGMEKNPAVLKTDGPRRDALLADLYKKSLIKSIPGPAQVRMEMKDLPASAFVQKATRRQLTPEYVQYMKIQWNYIHAEIEKAKVDFHLETNVEALHAIPEESLKPTPHR